jgi:hypothetical protein
LLAISDTSPRGGPCGSVGSSRVAQAIAWHRRCRWRTARRQWQRRGARQPLRR